MSRQSRTHLRFSSLLLFSLVISCAHAEQTYLQNSEAVQEQESTVQQTLEGHFKDHWWKYALAAGACGTCAVGALIYSHKSREIGFDESGRERDVKLIQAHAEYDEIVEALHKSLPEQWKKDPYI